MAGLALILGIAVTPLTVDCFTQDKDVGVILSVSDERVVIQGEMGLHVLELVGVCPWCEQGASVAVNFISHTRAELILTDVPTRKTPVYTMILRDGREGDSQ